MPDEQINILVFNESEEQCAQLSSLLDEYGFNVLKTSRVLQLTNLLKNNRISLVVASLSEAEAEEFKQLVSSTQPGTDTLFISNITDDNGNVAMTPSEFRSFIHNAIHSKGALKGEIEEFKEFFLTFAERLVQIFRSQEGYYSNKDHLVARLAHKTAFKMGLGRDMANTIHIAALLRDLGMLGIQKQYLDERKRFTEDELVPIRKHIFNTVQILKQIRFPWNVDAIILQHHENYDGSGYPMGLKGRAIAVGARIVHIADAYVAMLTDRPYRKAMSLDEANRELMQCTGSQFDPEVIEVFLEVIGEEMALGDKRYSFLLIDRDQNIAPLLRLSLETANYEIRTSDDAMEALKMLKVKVPDILIVNVEMLQKDYFIHFFNTMYEVPAMQECSYIFILPNSAYPRHFKGIQVRYLVQPVEMEELSASIKALLGEKTSKTVAKKVTRGLSGSLENMSLTDLIQILHMGLKTAKVELNSEDKWGVVYIQSGNVTHASTNEINGKEALIELMQWHSGDFHIRHGMKTTEVNIQADTIHLLHESARLKNSMY